MVSNSVVSRDTLVLSKIVVDSLFSVEVESNEAAFVVETDSDPVSVDNKVLFVVVSGLLVSLLVFVSNPVDSDAIASEVSNN